MSDLGPTGTEDDTPLSLEDAAKAFAGTTEEEEPDGSTSTDGDPDDTADTETEVEEGETDPDGEAEGEVEAELESERGRYVAHDGRVRMRDGTELTVNDLINGYMKDGDYRQKTTEASEVKKTYESQSSALKQRETQLNEQLEYVSTLIKSIIPQPPDPAMLSTDPMGYMQQEANHRAWSQHLAYIDQQKQQSADKAKSDAETQSVEKRKTEWNALLGKMPELKDDNRLKAFAADVNRFGETYGFTPQEIAGLALDHRQAIVLSKAIKWDKLQASKAKAKEKVDGKPPVQKGSSRLDPSRQKAKTADAAMERLNKSGTLKDGVAAYLATQNQG